jgi:hypothetical protein
MFGSPVSEHLKALPVLAMSGELKTVTRILGKPVEEFILFSRRQATVMPQYPIGRRICYALRMMI